MNDKIKDRILFLIDLDKTLISGNYKPTMEIEIFTALVDELVARGHILCLMSDSAPETLFHWHNIFHFNGPIIVENGVQIIWSGNLQKKCFDSKIDWLSIRSKFYDYIKHKLPSIEVLISDYYEYVSGNIKLPASQCIVINPNRRFSICVHALQQNSEKINFDHKLWSKLKIVINEFLNDLAGADLTKIDANQDYAVFILSEKQVNKTLAIPHIREKYPDYEIVVIGDGITDLVLANQGLKLYAVGNAITEMKNASFYVSEKELTEGVFEILNKIGG